VCAEGLGKAREILEVLVEKAAAAAKDALDKLSPRVHGPFENPYSA